MMHSDNQTMMNEGYRYPYESFSEDCGFFIIKQKEPQFWQELYNRDTCLLHTPMNEKIQEQYRKLQHSLSVYKQVKLFFNDEKMKKIHGYANLILQPSDTHDIMNSEEVDINRFDQYVKIQWERKCQVDFSQVEHLKLATNQGQPINFCLQIHQIPYGIGSELKQLLDQKQPDNFFNPHNQYYESTAAPPFSGYGGQMSSIQAAQGPPQPPTPSFVDMLLNFYHSPMIQQIYSENSFFKLGILVPFLLENRMMETQPPVAPQFYGGFEGQIEQHGGIMGGGGSIERQHIRNNSRSPSGQRPNKHKKDHNQSHNQSGSSKSQSRRKRRSSDSRSDSRKQKREQNRSRSGYRGQREKESKKITKQADRGKQKSDYQYKERSSRSNEQSGYAVDKTQSQRKSRSKQRRKKNLRDSSNSKERGKKHINQRKTKDIREDQYRKSISQHSDDSSSSQYRRRDQNKPFDQKGSTQHKHESRSRSQQSRSNNQQKSANKKSPVSGSRSPSLRPSKKDPKNKSSSDVTYSKRKGSSQRKVENSSREVNNDRKNYEEFSVQQPQQRRTQRKESTDSVELKAAQQRRLYSSMLQTNEQYNMELGGHQSMQNSNLNLQSNYSNISSEASPKSTRSFSKGKKLSLQVNQSSNSYNSVDDELSDERKIPIAPKPQKLPITQRIKKNVKQYDS